MNGIIGQEVMIKVLELIPKHMGYRKGEKQPVEHLRVVMDVAYEKEEGFFLLLVDPETGEFSEENIEIGRCRLLHPKEAVAATSIDLGMAN